MARKQNQAVVAPSPPEPASKIEDGLPPLVRKSRTPSAPHIKAVGGSGHESWDLSVLFRTMQCIYPVRNQGETEDDARTRVAGMAGIGVEAFKPTDPVEAMFASQALAMHLASMECFRRAMIPEQTSEVASKLRKDGVNAARGMADMVDALARHRGKGPQVIRVEKMLVSDGGQAVVGNVTTGTSLPTSGPTSHAIGQGAAPVAMLDAEPVKAGVGEGS